MDAVSCIKSKFLAGALGLAVFIVAVCLLPPRTRASGAQRELLDDFWERSQMSNLPGSMVWRVDLDLDGDGQPEILLSNQETAGKHGDLEWVVYSRIRNSQYRFVGQLNFSVRAFRVLRDPARVEALWFDDEHERAAGHTVRHGHLATYLVTPTHIALNSTARFEEADIETELAQMDAWRKAVALLVLGARLDKNGTLVNPSWNDLETGKPAAGVRGLEGLVVVD